MRPLIFFLFFLSFFVNPVLSSNTLGQDTIKKISFTCNVSSVLTGSRRYYFTEPSVGVVFNKHSISLAPLYYLTNPNDYSYGVHVFYQFCHKPQRKIFNWYYGVDFLYVILKENYSDVFLQNTSIYKSNDRFIDVAITGGVKIKLSFFKNTLINHMYFFESVSFGVFFEQYLSNESYIGNFNSYQQFRKSHSIDGLLNVGIGYKF